MILNVKLIIKNFIKNKLCDMHNIFGLEGDFEENKEYEECYYNLKNTSFYHVIIVILGNNEQY